MSRPFLGLLAARQSTTGLQALLSNECHHLCSTFQRSSAPDLVIPSSMLAHATASPVGRSTIRRASTLSSSPIFTSSQAGPFSQSEEDEKLSRWHRLATSHKRKPEKGYPLAQGVAYLTSRNQLSREHLEQGLSQLADVFIDNSHAYSLEELCAWCEICRQLDFAGSHRNHVAMTDAVRGALEGRITELEASHLPGVTWMLASADMPLSPRMEKELIHAICKQSEELGPQDLLEVSEAASRLALSRHSGLAACLVRAAARCLPACNPATAVRLVESGLPSSLSHSAPERDMLLDSMCHHMARHKAEYTRDTSTLERALKLVSGLAAGHPGLQDCVRAMQHMAHMMPQETAGAATK